MKAKLLNVIELEPYGFVPDDITISYPSNATTEQNKQYYEAYWQATPFAHLPRVTSDLYFVDMNDIDDDLITLLIKTELDDIDEPDFLDCICKLYGGITVIQDDKVIISPNCCGDVSDISEWLKIFTARSANWHLIWNGHPSIFYRIVNNGMEDMVEFAHQKNEMELANENIQVEFRMPLIEFERQIKQMQILQIHLRDRFLEQLANMKDSRLQNNAREIANIICGIDEQ